MSNNIRTAAPSSSNGECHQRTAEEVIREICADVLGRSLARVKMHKSFLSQGGDSLLAIKLMASCDEAGFSLTIQNILQATSITELCRFAESSKKDVQLRTTNETNGATLVNGNAKEGAMGLTEMQTLYISAKSAQTKVFRIRGGIARGALVDALEMLVDMHPMLLARVSENSHELGLEIQGRGSFIHELCEVEADIEIPGMTLMESVADLPESHLFSAVIFVQKGTSNVRYLGIVASLAVVNEKSWDTLLEDLETALTNNKLDGQHRMAFSTWVEGESTRSSDSNFLTAATPSSSYISGNTRKDLLENGAANGQTSKENCDGIACNELRFDLDQATTGLLLNNSTHAVLRTDPRDFLVAAFYLALQSISKEHGDCVSLHTIADGRPGGNSGEFSSTIGCFDRIVTLVVEKGNANDGDINLLRRVKDSRMGLVQLVDQTMATTSTTHTDVDYVLNLTGMNLVQAHERKTLEEMYKKEEPGHSLLTALPTRHLLYVEPVLAKRHVSFCLRDEGSQHRSSFSQIASLFQSYLTGLLSRFQSYELHGAPSDFPLLNTTNAEFDELVSNQLKRITRDPLRDVEDVFPCSPIQEVFLISQSINPELYQCSGVIEIKSTDVGVPLDYSRLDNAWKHIVKQHPSLRTVFIDSVNRPGHLDQVVLKEALAPLTHLDGGSDGSTSSNLLSRRPVTFENYHATHQATICRRSAYSALFRIDISHALVDGTSVQVLFRDFSQFYLNQRPAAAILPYQDFVSYQQHLSSDASIAYWSGYLAGAEPSVFPTNSDNVDRQDLRTVQSLVDITPEGLDQFCGKFNVTTANICQVAWALVLRSYTGSDDVCFSYVSSGREAPLKGIQNTIGAFVDTMICRVQMSGAVTVSQTLSKVKHDLMEGLSHPGVAGYRREFSLLRGNTIMSCQREASGEFFKGSGLTFEMLDAVNPSEYDITLNIQTGRKGLEVRIDFWDSHINQTTAESVLESFKQALEIILSESAPLGDIDVIPTKQIAQIRKWNKDIPPRLESLIQDRVHQHRILRPNAPAVSAWDGDLTYQELEDEANKLASYIASLGVQAGAKIPFCFEKSKWAVISQLAILKTGGCVVPLGPTQPMQRLEIILKDIDANIILTTDDIAGRFKDILPHVVVVDDTLMSQLSDSEPPICSATSDDLAFVMYTSGSTGIPKGVMVTHGSICTSLHYMGAKFKLGPHTRMLQFSAFTFDISIQDIYTTWHYGGCLCIISEEDRLNNLGPAMNSYGVNSANLTSTVAGMVSPNEAPSLKTLVLIGEALKPDAVNRWIDHAAVFNGYGPTECSILASISQLTPGCNVLNIGYAFAGALWVVDGTNYNRLVPIGVPGELLIEGPLQARGYLNDEKKTAEAFVTDPTWASRYGFGTPRRFYRTGDLVQQNLDGSITYMGRRDTQIKFHGQRVETGEIEHHLIQLDAVLDAAVFCPSKGPCKDRLIGVLSLREFVSEKSSGTDIIPVSLENLSRAKHQTAGISNYLIEHIPEYMIPTVWIPLASKMPQNDSSKLDRKKLGQWVEGIDQALVEALTFSGDGQGQTRPPTPLEQQIQNVWAEVLNLPISHFGVENRSFMSLGGDSITAMQVVSRARAQGISLLVRDILQKRSIAQLAQTARATQQSIQEEEDSDEPFPLSPIQQWYFENIPLHTMELQSGGDRRFNQSVCLAPRKALAQQSVANAMNTIVSKHQSLRSRFHADVVHGWLQRVVGNAEGSYGFRASDVEGPDEAKALMVATQGSLDLQDGPVFSAQLINFKDGGKDKQLLFMAAHHLVIDIMSWRIILRDLDELLRNRSPSAHKILSFRTWNKVQTEALQRQVAGAEELDNDVLPFEIPLADLDFWGLAANTNLGKDEVMEDVSLDEHHTALLFGTANHTLRTEPVEILLAALTHSFSRTFPDRPVPAVFNEGHGREPWEPGVDGTETVGWFTTIVPIHAPITNKDSVVDTLKRIKDARRSIPQRGLPYFSSRFLTTQGRAAFSSHRQMEVLFNYAGALQQLEQGSGLFDLENLTGSGTSPVGDGVKRPSVFTIEAISLKNKLQVSFRFNRNMQHKDKVQDWAQTYIGCLRDLVTELVAAPPMFTLSDFPLAGMTYESLERLHGKILTEAGLRPDDIEDIYPCSPIQQGILMSQAKSPSEYQIQQAFEIRSPNPGSRVRVEDITQGWQTLTNRHPILRTIFVPQVSAAEDGTFDQVVLKHCKANIEHKRCEDDDIETLLSIKTSSEMRIHGTQPSHELKVYSTPSGRTYASIIISHALVDASSLILMQNEWLQAYDGKLAPDTTGPLYSEYISYLQQTPVDDSLEYWTLRLADMNPCYLPTLTVTGMPEDVTATMNKRQPMQSVAKELEGVKEVQAFSETQSITLANIFQLAWALVLSKYTGTSDISFGYLASGRDVAIDGVHELVGPLINMMVTRIKVDPDMSAQQALHQVQSDFFDGFNHQRASLLDIWHALELKGQSLFNTSLSYRHAGSSGPGEASLILDIISGEDPTEYDANVTVLVSENKISVSLQYSPDFICREAATSLLGCLLQATKSLVSNQGSTLREVSIVTEEDVQQLRKWNSEVPKTAQSQCIHDVVHHQGLANPDATAVCAWDGDLTYQELEGLADQLAHHLVSVLAIGPESRVALCFDKSRWAVVAQLAILKAGGTVVSINPKHPIQRLEVLLNDICADVMLTTHQYADRFANLIPNIIRIDSDLFLQLPKLVGPACHTVKPENAAFMIYTSGSTGLPKGVVLTHSSLFASFQAQGREYGMRPETRSVQFASYTFDASISDIWGTLSHGGCVCVISEDERMNDLQAAFQSYRVNLAQLTPTVAALLDLPKLSLLETLVLGGEALKPAMIEEFIKAYRVRILNGYGPTECSIYTTNGKPLRDKRQASIIGRPLAGGVWIVDEQNFICPIGAAGELWIEGPLLAREYLNDKVKTDKSFVRDPVWARHIGLQGHRFYRTGDLVRQSHTGDVIYLGRKDTQVKIRGQRVEVGEIEYRVKKCLPEVIDVVAALIVPSGNTRGPLVAVAMELGGTLRPGPETDSAGQAFLPISDDFRKAFTQLRISLSDVLPSYMLPGLYVPVAQFPRTTSDKVDRRLLSKSLESLPDKELSQYALSNSEKVGPTTVTETKLQSLWAAVLGVNIDQVGIQDHFLHSGGDSFTAMRLVSMANSSGADISLSVADVFKHPRLADMARFVDQKTSPDQQSEGEIPRFALWKEIRDSVTGVVSEISMVNALSQVAIQCRVSVDDIEDVYPCTPLQEGLMAITAQQPRAYVGRWAFGIPETVDIERFKDSWQTLSSVAAILRTRIVPGQLSGALQVVVSEEMAWFSGSNLDQYLAEDAEKTMAYGSPLVRSGIIETSQNERLFVLTAHHSVYDGWSLGKIFETVSRLYSLEDIPIAEPYTRFIRYLEQQDTTAAESFWRSQLEGDNGTPFPALPKPSHQPQPSQSMTSHLEVGLLEGSITLAALLRAAWALAVSSHSGNNVLFATTLSGRAAPVRGILDMMGPTITTVPVQIHVDNAQTVNDYLTVVHQQAIDTMPFEHTGLQHIRRLVENDIDLRHLFAVQPAGEREDFTSGGSLGLENKAIPMEGFDSYALTVECTTGLRDETAIEVVARFDEDVISGSRMRRLLDRFRHIFGQLSRIHNDDHEGNAKLVGDIDMLSPEEVSQVAEWNQGIPEKMQTTVHHLVHQQAIIQPDAPAVCSWDGDLSRHELDQISEQLASHLVSLGVGPEVMVPVCLDKSKWAVVAMLATLKAGGVVVPVAANPVQRLYAILQDTGAHVVLTTPHYASQFQGRVPHILPVDDKLFSKMPVALERLEQTVRPSNASFVVYTSGSTGNPKGTVVEHGTMSTSMQSHGNKFSMNEKTRAFQFSHFTFDISLHDVFTTLQFGGCVCLPSEEERVNNLAGSIRRSGVNYLFLTPTVLRTIKPSDIPAVKTLIVGGEAVQAEDVEPWVHHARVFNAYGPAECSIISTIAEVFDGSKTPNIGRAVAGGLWVVDEMDYNRLVPVGVVGELLIEGPLLARGYLNNEEKTSTSFVNNPTWLARYGLNSEGGVRRMYRTGDLVIQKDDGSLGYIGRSDTQVKIRGQRIEIGETEHHLTQHAAVSDAVVLYPRRGPSHSRLVGLLTLHGFKSNLASDSIGVQPIEPDQIPRALTQASLVRQQLQECVPAYMVPDFWICLASMPQSSSDKIDRKKLIVWLEEMDASFFESITRGGDDEAPEMPANELEQQLQHVLAEVLKLPIEKVVMSRPFLSMGGDSITAMQVVSRCRTRYGISVLVRDILQSKSITQLALKAVTEIVEVEEVDMPNTPFNLTPIQEIYFESFASSGLHVSGEDRFNQSVLLAAQHHINSQEIVHAAKALVTDHPMLRARFHETDQGWKQSILAEVEGSFHLGIHDVQSREEAEMVISSAQRQLNLEQGPVFSIDCMKISADNSQLVFLTAHHLVVDLVSWRVIVRDLEDHIQHPTRAVSTESTSFQRWARLQAKHAQDARPPTKALQIQAPVSDWSYWGVSPETNVYGNLTTEQFVLDKDDTLLLFGDNQPLRTEPIEVLLAALFHSFHQAFPDRPVPTVFNEGHGRESWTDSIDLSDTVGWFTTMTPIHVELSSDTDDVVDLLRRTKDARRSIPEHGLAYFESRGRETLKSRGAAEIMFNYGGRYRQQPKDAEGLFQIENGLDEPRLSPVGSNVKRLAVFEIDASVWEDQLSIKLSFCRTSKNQDGVLRWVQSYRSALQELLKRLSTTPLTFTLADFPTLSLTYSEISRLQTKLLPQVGITDSSDVEDIYPCAPIQQGILLSQIRDPSTYHVQQICEFQALKTSRVDLNQLSNAWKAVVSRHSILRTVFIPSTSAGDLFYQVVLKQWNPRILRAHCDGAGDAVASFAKHGRPEYTDGEPQHELTICTTATGETFARVYFSHALMDASSLALIFHDLIQAYDGMLTDSPAPSYGTYVAFLQQESAAGSLAYWTERLADAQPCYLPSPATPIAKSGVLSTVKAVIDDQQLIHRFRDNHGVTVANIVQLAWGIVLASYTGSKDVTFGYLANGRDAPIVGVNEMTGPMINMTVTRIRLGVKGMTVAEVARQVQDDFLEAFNNQRTSLSDIQHALHLSEQSLFNTTVSYNRQPSQQVASPAGLTVQGISGEDPTEYDVNLNVTTDEHTMKISLQYSASFLGDDSAKHLLDSLQNTLVSITASDEAQLDEVEVVSPSDIARLRMWNANIPTALHGAVHNKIHQQRLSHPDASAVCAWDGRLTNSGLDSLADRLANHLTDLGIGKECMVGLCFEKSMWTIVAMLAVLKAGGVIVPLGYQLPLQRLRLIVDDTRASVVLTSDQCATKFTDISVPHIVTVDANLFARLPENSNPQVRQTPNAEDAAVVIYTSGSTGRPKGVVLTHGALYTSLEKHGAKLNFSANTRALQFSAYVFDVSLLDTLGVLQFGGCVCIVSEEDRMDIKSLAVSMETMGVTFACLTPTVANIIDPRAVPTLHTLGLAGEALHAATFEIWSPHVEIFNCYGPAECTVLSTINGPITDKNRSSNIGTCIAGVSWVVDQSDYNSLVPIGAMGELLIEGPILARGYLHDPEKTTASFVTDPTFVSRYGLGSGRGRRMYRTGDLVKQNLADGSITYMGRGDGQVKVRGQRVEVGEIEYSVKQALPQVQMAAADLVTPSVRGGHEAIMFVAMELRKDDTESTSSPHESPFLPLTELLRKSLLELQATLTEELPSFMVPAIYVPVDQMPLTASGKLDRRSLKALLESLSEEQLSNYGLAEESSMDSSTQTERQLQELWATALHTSGRIGTNSNFFRSGGDSVTAMRLVALARDADPPMLISVADVFKNPVLANMAKLVDEKPSEKFRAATEGLSDEGPFSLWPGVAKPGPDDFARLALQFDIAPEAIEDAYPCTPLQEGLLAITAQQSGAYVNRWVFRMDETVDAGRFKEAWQQVFDMAPILRTRIVEDSTSGILQVVIREQIDWVESSSSLEFYLTQDAAKHMGFGTPLTRFAIVGTSSSERFFVWTAHHSVYDGWSSRKLFEAVSHSYLDLGSPKFVPFTRFVRYLQLASSAAEAKKYWQAQLEGDLGPSFPELPPNHQPGAHQVLTRSINVPRTTTSVTTATLLRAAWAFVLSAESGSQDAVFATPLSSRTSPVAGILDIMGPTIATVPVRIHLDQSQSITDYLAMVQQQSLDMMPFEQTGLQNISQMITNAPLPLQHLFVVQPSADRLDQGDATFPGLSSVPLEAANAHGYPLVMECNTGSDNENNVILLRAFFDEAALPSEKMQGVLERFEHVFLQLQRAATASTDDRSNQIVGIVDVVSPRDIKQIRSWNRPCQPKANICVHELFYQQRRDRPDAPAVCAWDGDLSYSQLENLSSRLAHYLVSLGIGPESPVALIFEKSKWAVVAQLATLMAGGIVVSINHKHPAQRIKDILEVSRAKIILTSLDIDRYIGLVPHVEVVDQQLLAQLPSQPGLACETVGPENAAFVIFTSGSTGIPKGVVLQHGSLVAVLLGLGDLYAGPTSRVLQFSAYTFDISIADIFCTLAVGGCICVISEEDRASNLASAMKAFGITGAMITPTVAGLIKPDQVPTLETLVLVGEALKPEVLTDWTGGRVKIFNGYGPSECSIIASVGGPITEASQAPNIGTTWDGNNLWVADLSDYHRLVPVGSVGELLIEGPLVARGYLNDTQKTDQVFLTDPAWLQRYDFVPNSGRRFYKTGDLVRQNLDGSVVYLGRCDTQVKIHGQRVEVGEIEYWVKKKLGEVREVVAGLVTTDVVESQDGTSATLLVAVVEMGTPSSSGATSSLVPLSDDQRQSFADLRRALFDVLPAYMVPQLYLPMTKLPLTDSGKLDRRSIMKVVQQTGSLFPYFLQDQAKVSPTTDTERQLQELWSAALKIPASSISAGDDFFSLGGNSISAMRLVAKARQNGYLSLTVADVLRYPILSDLAAIANRNHVKALVPAAKYEPFSALGATKTDDFIAQSIKQLTSTSEVIIDAAPTTDFQALAVVSSLKKSRDMLAYVGLDGDGFCDIARWKASCLGLVKSHDILRTAYVFHQKQLVQVVLQDYQPDITHFETDQPIDQFTKLLVAQDMYHVPSLGQPFTQFAIITSKTDSRHRILFRLSHGEYDAITISYFISTLKAIYDGQQVEEYPSFSRYMYNLSIKDKKESLEYWRTLLQGSSMPRIRPLADKQPQHQSKLVYHADRKVKIVKELPKGITLATIVRAAWARVLADHASTVDVVFGEVVSGRNTGDPDAEKTAGCCANIVPVRVALSDSWTVHDLLHHLQEQQITRIQHETLGFREILNTCAEMSPSTVFTSQVNHVGQDPRMSINIAERDYDVSMAFPEGAGHPIDISITSIAGPGYVEIALGYLDQIIPSHLAEELLNSLCGAVDEFANGTQDGTL